MKKQKRLLNKVQIAFTVATVLLLAALIVMRKEGGQVRVGASGYPSPSSDAYQNDYQTGNGQYYDDQFSSSPDSSHETEDYAEAVRLFNEIMRSGEIIDGRANDAESIVSRAVGRRQDARRVFEVLGISDISGVLRVVNSSNTHGLLEDPRDVLRGLSDGGRNFLISECGENNIEICIAASWVWIFADQIVRDFNSGKILTDGGQSRFVGIEYFQANSELDRLRAREAMQNCSNNSSYNCDVQLRIIMEGLHSAILHNGESMEDVFMLLEEGLRIQSAHYQVMNRLFEEAGYSF